MNKLMLILLPLLFVSTAAWAADEYPEAEIFGGFSILSMGSTERTQHYGFQASAAGNFHPNIGIIADFGGQYGDGTHEYEYLFGPQFSIRKEKATVFAHVLLGGESLGTSGGTGGFGGGGFSTRQFAMGFGGGLDINIKEKFALRVIQFDWNPVHIQGGGWDNSAIRFGFGLVYKK
jgi:hypothetical protein